MELTIYDIRGKALVAWSLKGEGYRTISWQGQDRTGKLMGNGMYVVRLTGDKVLQKKLLLMK